MGVNGSREDESVMGILVKRFNECTAHKNVLNDGSSNRAKSLKNLRHLQKKAARSLPLFCTNFVYFFPSTKLKFKSKTIEEFLPLYIYFRITYEYHLICPIHFAIGLDFICAKRNSFEVEGRKNHTA